MNINTRIAMSAVSIVTSLALMSGAAFAAFTAQATNTGNTFTAGTMTLLLNPTNNMSQTTPLFTVAGFMPGQSKAALITLKNNGSVDASHVVLHAINNNPGTKDISPMLNLTLINDPSGDDTINNGNRVDPSGDDGVIAGPTVITSTGWNDFDLGFALAQAASHQIVAVVTFDSSANDTFQGANTSFDLTFQANQ